MISLRVDPRRMVKVSTMDDPVAGEFDILFLLELWEAIIM